MKNQLEKMVASIVESYQKIGGINHLQGPNLPSRRSIIGIVQAFESLVFPGYGEDELIDELSMKYMIGEKIIFLTRSLQAEIERSLAYQERFHGQSHHRKTTEAASLTMAILQKILEIRRKIKLDVEAAFLGDPAAKSHEEVILSYPCIEAILVYRLAHEFYINEIPLIPRMMTEYIHSKTGIDIHPGAQIGEYFFIDHGTGVVIGETTVIGKNVKLYQGVTLGALSVKKEEGGKKRHPTIEDEVTIYAGATILGGQTVIGRGSVIGGNVWLTNSVPPYSRVYYQPENYIYKKAGEAPFDYQI